ncbi:hypothetical protein Hte_010682 [Hypoxylon texense]
MSTAPNGTKTCAGCTNQIPKNQPYPYCSTCEAKKKEEERKAKEAAEALLKMKSNWAAYTLGN